MKYHLLSIKMCKVYVGIGLLAACHFLGAVRGATLQWDADGVAPLGGTGPWDTTNPFWFDGVSYVNWNNASNDDAVFGGTAGTVTLSAPITANSLTFNTTGYTLAGGGNTLTLGLGGISVTTGTATVNTALGGTSGLTKSGSGTLAIGTVGSYTGTTTAGGGILQVAVSNALNTAGLLDINSGAELRLFAGAGTATADRRNQTVAGVTGAGVIRWGNQADMTNGTLTLNVGSGSQTFTGTATTSVTGASRRAAILKTGAGTQVWAPTIQNLQFTDLRVNGGIFQLGSTNIGGYLNLTSGGTAGTLDLNGFSISLDTTAGATITNTSATTSTLSAGVTGTKTWAAPITGNIRLNNSIGTDVTLNNGSNSFTGGVGISSGAFVIGSAASLPANQIDLNGGNLDFTAGLTLDAGRTFTVGTAGGALRYRNNAAGTVNLQGVINNNGATPGALTFRTHPSNTGVSTFNVSGGGNFSGNLVIGPIGGDDVNVTVRPGSANGLPTNSRIDFGSGDNRTYSLDLNGFNQQVAGLQNTGTGVNIRQRVINSSGTAATFTVNNNTASTFSGLLGDTGGDNFSLAKTGTGTLTLSGTSTYTGTTSIQSGTLVRNGSHTGGGAYTVDASGTLAGSGTISASVSVSGTLAPGNSPGILSTGSQTWFDGGDYNFQMVDAGSTAGIGWDLINITGNLDLSSLSVDGFNINLWSLSAIGPDVNGDALNFDSLTSDSWVIAQTTGGILGFSAADFEIFTAANNGTAGFSNSHTGTFSVGVVGNDLVLNYTAVPEPSMGTHLAMALGMLLFCSRARRFRSAA
jgi:fibronectin-binding autotransporter adhesin